jgi:hypothetical protein
MNQNTAYFSFHRRFLMVLLAGSIATGCASSTHRVDPKKTMIKACVNSWFRERGPISNAEMAYNAYTEAEKVCRTQVIKYYNKK